MKTKDLRFESVYTCTTPHGDIAVYYYGMSEDRYVFIPYDTKKKHFVGLPNGLTEKEVSKQIKAYNEVAHSPN